MRKRRTVRPVIGQSVVSVRDCQNTGTLVHFTFQLQAVVTRTVVVRVQLRNDLQHVIVRAAGLQHADSNAVMDGQYVGFFIREFSGLQQNLIADANFAEVMQ